MFWKSKLQGLHISYLLCSVGGEAAETRCGHECSLTPGLGIKTGLRLQSYLVLSYPGLLCKDSQGGMLSLAFECWIERISRPDLPAALNYGETRPPQRDLKADASRAIRSLQHAGGGAMSLCPSPLCPCHTSLPPKSLHIGAIKKQGRWGSQKACELFCAAEPHHSQCLQHSALSPPPTPLDARSPRGFEQPSIG